MLSVSFGSVVVVSVSVCVCVCDVRVCVIILRSLTKQQISSPAAETFVVCGFSRKVGFMLHEFEEYVAAGSRVLAIPGVSAEEFNKNISAVRPISVF